MWKAVLPKGAKMVSTAAGAAAGAASAAGLAPSEAECRASHQVQGSSTVIMQPSLESLKLSRSNSDDDAESWFLCEEDELRDACYDVFGKRPRIIEIDNEMYRGSQPVLSHDLSDDVESIESIGADANRLMEQIHLGEQNEDRQTLDYHSQLQLLADVTMEVASRPNVQEAVKKEMQQDPYFQEKIEMILYGYKRPMLPPTAQNILEGDLTNSSEETHNTEGGVVEGILHGISATLQKIGDGFQNFGHKVGDMFHNLANKLKSFVTGEEQSSNVDSKGGTGGGNGWAVGLTAVTVLATAIIMIVVFRRAGVHIPRRR